MDESDKKEGLLKRLKNIEDKSKDQLDEIKDQGEKQLNATEKQNHLKTIEKHKIVYLEDEIDKLFEMYPNSFDKKDKALLNKLAKNENSINYKNLSYKILLPDDTFHELIF